MKRLISLLLALTSVFSLLALASCSEEADTASTNDISVADSVSSNISIAPPPSVISGVETQIIECVYGDDLADFLGDAQNLMEDYFDSYSEISVTKGFDYDGTSRAELGQEFAPNLFDGDTATKWCCGDTDVEGCSAVVWKMNKAVTVTNYTFTTANDSAEYYGRNPIGWRLYATNNELNSDMAMTNSMFSGDSVPEGWVLISEVSETKMPDENFTECGWAVDEENQGEFTGYMLLIDSCDYLNSVFQLSEIALYGNA